MNNSATLIWVAVITGFFGVLGGGLSLRGQLALIRQNREQNKSQDLRWYVDELKKDIVNLESKLERAGQRIVELEKQLQDSQGTS